MFVYINNAYVQVYIAYVVTFLERELTLDQSILERAHTRSSKATRVLWQMRAWPAAA